MKKTISLYVFLLLLLHQLCFAQTTLRIEDASTFTAGFCGFNGSRANSYAGADNGYYINLSNSSARGIDWKVSVPSAGTYTLRWRYANAGSQSATTARVLVNGATALASVSFPKTASWTTWTTATGSVTLSQGVNTIRLETIAAAEFANIDWIEVVGNSPVAASCSGQPVENYTLTTSASPSAGGSVTRSPNATTYPAGTVVTLTAVPATGYTFVNWSGAASGSSLSVSVTVDANKSVVANFTQGASGSYTLTTAVSPSAGGTVTRSPNASSYTAGTVVTLTATPASGYTFSGWSGSISGNTSPVAVTMDAGKSVTANFTQSNTGVSFALVGYATLAGGTTGGAGGTSVTVNTGTALQNAINAKGSAPLTIYVNGTITPSNSSGLSKIDVKDQRDISILGVGTSGEFNGIGIKIVRAGNIILRNLKIHHVNIGDKDCIGIEGPADHIWVDHCELYNAFQGVDQDYYDGLLDAKAEAEYITYSWNYLHDSWKTGLVGSSESDTYDRKITMHHNFYENCNSRLPLYRGGVGHIFNNYYKDIASTAINSRIGACLQIENNYFLNTLNPYVSAYSDVVGYGELIGNVLVNSPFQYASDVFELGACTLTIPYTYSNVLHSGSNVPAVVSTNAGVGKIDVYSATTAAASERKEQALSLSVYPNPSKGSGTITFQLPAEGAVAFQVTDMMGNTVWKNNAVSLPAGVHTMRIDIPGSGRGVYVVKMYYQGKWTEEKVLLER